MAWTTTLGIHEFQSTGLSDELLRSEKRISRTPSSSWCSTEIRARARRWGADRQGSAAGCGWCLFPLQEGQYLPQTRPVWDCHTVRWGQGGQCSHIWQSHYIVKNPEPSNTIGFGNQVCSGTPCFRRKARNPAWTLKRFGRRVVESKGTREGPKSGASGGRQDSAGRPEGVSVSPGESWWVAPSLKGVISWNSSSS